VVGYRPVVHARKGFMLGIRHPLDGPVFETKQDAENWCIHAMISHYDRRLGMSDATIYPFKGMVGYELSGRSEQGLNWEASGGPKASHKAVQRFKT